MTPKEKADELIDKMYYSGRYDDKEDYIPAMAWDRAKQCALMAVEEILNNNCGSHTDEANATNSEIYCDEYFWNNVKSELQSF
jgi:hypothetical protein